MNETERNGTKRNKVSYVEASRDGRHLSVLIRYDESRGRIMKQYEVELPGPILVGEGKPNNQNHAIIFTRGEALQAIDMNQDGGDVLLYINQSACCVGRTEMR